MLYQLSYSVAALVTAEAPVGHQLIVLSHSGFSLVSAAMSMVGVTEALFLNISIVKFYNISCSIHLNMFIFNP